jgi:hypothetical protein
MKSEREIYLEKIIKRLRGQLENCINHLERANKQFYNKGEYSECIDSSNRTLYETSNID